MSKQIYRIEGYIKHYKIKNIIFISHTRLSAELFYKDLKNLINLEGYNILFMSNDPKKMDGLLPNETLGIMCGIWYKDKRIRENDYFWSFIDSIKTLPLAEIDCKVNNSVLTIDINSESVIKAIEEYRRNNDELKVITKEQYLLRRSKNKNALEIWNRISKGHSFVLNKDNYYYSVDYLDKLLLGEHHAL